MRGAAEEEAVVDDLLKERQRDKEDREEVDEEEGEVVWQKAAGAEMLRSER